MNNPGSFGYNGLITIKKCIVLFILPFIFQYNIFCQSAAKETILVSKRYVDVRYYGRASGELIQLIDIPKVDQGCLFLLIAFCKALEQKCSEAMNFLSSVPKNLSNPELVSFQNHIQSFCNSNVFIPENERTRIWNTLNPQLSGISNDIEDAEKKELLIQRVWLEEHFNEGNYLTASIYFYNSSRDSINPRELIYEKLRLE